jgi:hypothetical protein
MGKTRFGESTRLIRVIRVILPVCPRLPVFPRKRTSSRPVGMSQKCRHQQTHAPRQLAVTEFASCAYNDVPYYPTKDTTAVLIGLRWCRINSQDDFHFPGASLS